MTQDSDKQNGAGATLLARLAVALVQGALLYWATNFRFDQPLYGIGASDWPIFVETARTFAVLAPLPLIFGLGNLPTLRLALWSLAASLGLIYVGSVAPAPVWTGAPAVITVWLFSLIVIYIVHEFIQAAHADRRPIARYETYFDFAWRHAFQVILAFIFLGAFWVVLWLGAWLFQLIGVKALEDLITSDEFYYPASTTAFVLGVHLTDASSGLTRGARTIGLALLSWLTILLTLILTAFLLALPFTGLEPLWDTKRATVLLLNAAATMILLVNAAFQAGEPPKSALMRWITRASAAPVIGVVGLAAIGLWMRVNQYGLTPARVVAGAELLIVTIYAIGYAAAAVKPGRWMALVKPVNIFAAATVAFVLLLLMTPIADPARLSVENQISRLESGRVKPDDFDFGFLADARARHWGKEALAKLAKKGGTPRDERIALLAAHPVKARDFYWRSEQSFNDRRASIRLIGSGEIPDSALLPPAIGPDPMARCANSFNVAKERAALAEEEARRRKRFGGQPAAFDPASPPTPDEAVCLAQLADLDFDGDEDLFILSPPHWSGYSREPTYSALIADETAGWRALGEAGDSYVVRNRTEWRVQRAEIERTFKEARIIHSGRLDLDVNNQRIRWAPTQTLLSTDEMRAGIEMRGDGEPPGIVLTDSSVHSFVSECARATANSLGVEPACFGRYLDVTGDGVDEFISMKFALPATPSIQIYAYDGNGWRAAGVAEADIPDRLNPWSLDTKGETLSDYVARLRLRTVDEMLTLPPLLADIEIDGDRIIFDYTEAVPAPDGTMAKPPQEQFGRR